MPMRRAKDFDSEYTDGQKRHGLQQHGDQRQRHCEMGIQRRTEVDEQRWVNENILSIVFL